MLMTTSKVSPKNQNSLLEPIWQVGPIPGILLFGIHRR